MSALLVVRPRARLGFVLITRLATAVAMATSESYESTSDILHCATCTKLNTFYGIASHNLRYILLQRERALDYGYVAAFSTDVDFCFFVGGALVAPTHIDGDGNGALNIIPNTSASFARRAARTSTCVARGVGGGRTPSIC